jgi:Domain of unknown function (DUF4833)
MPSSRGGRILRGVSLGVRLALGLALSATALFIAPLARGRLPAGRLVPSVFFVAKSENRNQVHYGIALDDACAPVGDHPVFAYWRMLARGPSATEPLLWREVPAYGVAQQRATTVDGGGRVTLTLSALPRRPIVVDTHAGGDGCVATATTEIGNAPARLSNVYVKLRWPFGVDYLLLTGRSSSDGRTVRERVTP